jgi:hypothetical protein
MPNQYSIELRISALRETRSSKFKVQWFSGVEPSACIVTFCSNYDSPYHFFLAITAFTPGALYGNIQADADSYR